MKTKMKRRHPENTRLDKALKEAEENGQVPKGSIDKRFTSLKTMKSVEGTGEVGETMRPSDDQLAKINEFTRKTVTADDVVAFTTMSCNDVPDRDDDQFTRQCIKDFAKLPEPYSSVGKSYMVGHDHTSLGVGRIFDVAEKKVEGINFLTNDVYIPNTDANKAFIEAQDFGINWAVSVGVVLGKAACSIPGCDATRFVMGMWCTNGHDKGAYYDPNSDEEDSWGYPAPSDPSDKNAVKCLQLFEEPQDFYELSQVYLGAQYYAELKKRPELAGAIKTASSRNVPIIGLSKSEALSIDVPFKGLPSGLRQARQEGRKILNEDGVYKWLQGSLVYTFDPDEDEDAMCLGEADENQLSQFSEGESEDPDPEDVDPDDEEDDDEDDDNPEPGDENAPTNTPTEETMSKKAVLAAATKAKLPAPILERLAEVEGDDNGLDLVLDAAAAQIRSKDAEIASLTAKAEVGKQYSESLKQEAVAAYCKARASEGEKVNTKTVEKILDSAGDDIDLIKSIRDEYLDEARAKFPSSVRRSSSPEDTAKVEPKSQDEDNETRSDRVVSRIHG